MRLILFTMLFVIAIKPVSAQVQKALIIGIDTYKPDGESAAADAGRASWMNLDGCVNDAASVKDLVVAKYAFANNNVTTLFNQEASRSRIISELTRLAKEAKKGDVIFIYYAGHGSQVYNSLSTEADKKDESIV
ncbi:MAG TPA: caspase family protein, partial [Chitinophagaceae bacterium]